MRYTLYIALYMDLRLSAKAEYGLKAMVDIALQPSDKPVQVIDIARRQEITRESIAVLMVDLKRAGLVTSVRGPAGGYLLTRNSAEISMKQIIEALEGPIDVIQKQKQRHGTAAAVRETWHNCLAILVSCLEDTSLENLAKFSQSNSSLTKSNPSDSRVPDGYAFNI